MAEINLSKQADRVKTEQAAFTPTAYLDFSTPRSDGTVLMYVSDGRLGSTTAVIALGVDELKKIQDVVYDRRFKLEVQEKAKKPGLVYAF